ncbi:MAG: peptidylprolyl isomerase [Tepidisphaeraceae bacterium]|jgi:peptidyl-prolyl cis-trans isomerase B (cyclophilin B)
MQVVSLFAALFSVLVPAKMWVAGNQPIKVTDKSDAAVTFVLTDFSGRVMEAKGDCTVQPGAEADVRQFYPAASTPGAYVLWAVPKGKQLPEFIGTPLVLTVRADRKPGSPNPNEVHVTKVEPLRYGVMTTDKGVITCVFYYDVAPNTTATMQMLAEQGYFDGLAFHRIVPGFVVQAGDPLGDGRGGPGFNANAEFSDRKHEAGVLSMARRGDDLERQGFPPRAEFANSAGSQFFICTGVAESLDKKYTAFGKVTAGMEVVKAIEGVPVADKQTGRPQTAPVIQKFEIKNVTPAENPYKAIMSLNP